MSDVTTMNSDSKESLRLKNEFTLPSLFTDAHVDENLYIVWKGSWYNEKDYLSTIDFFLFVPHTNIV